MPPRPIGCLDPVAGDDRRGLVAIEAPMSAEPARQRSRSRPRTGCAAAGARDCPPTDQRALFRRWRAAAKRQGRCSRAPCPSRRRAGSQSDHRASVPRPASATPSVPSPAPATQISRRQEHDQQHRHHARRLAQRDAGQDRGRLVGEDLVARHRRAAGYRRLVEILERRRRRSDDHDLAGEHAGRKPAGIDARE